jgi:hypothetical protein
MKEGIPAGKDIKPCTTISISAQLSHLSIICIPGRFNFNAMSFQSRNAGEVKRFGLKIIFVLKKRCG